MLITSGADIKYNRAHRLDVALVQNHPIALCVMIIRYDKANNAVFSFRPQTFRVSSRSVASRSVSRART